ncbi:MAG: alpha/beta fold hydrolase [Frankiaceae bacterium]
MNVDVLQFAGGVAYRRLGRGEPLVLIHGAGGSRRSWDSVLPFLEHRDVVAVDLPGFGDSPPLPDAPPHTPAMMAAGVERFLGVMGLDRPHVVGHSYGGWVALELARSGCAGAVTAVCPAGLWPSTAQYRARLELRKSRALAVACRRIAPLLLSSRTGRRVLLATSSVRPADVDPGLAIAAAADLAAAPGFLPVYRGMIGARFTGGTALSPPLHLVLAANDRLLPPAHNSCSTELPAHAIWSLLPGCGHAPQWDAPAVLATAILRDMTATG